MISNATSKKPQFGEIFITNDEVGGSLESLKVFRGRLITNACGGYKKLFIIEESYSNEGLVSSLHAPEYDDYDYTFAEEAKSVKNLEDIFQAFNDKGQIKKMVCGKKHTVFITEEGKIYSYGIGEYGSLGHGGLIYSDIPKNIIKFKDKKIIQVTCGEFHTLALTSTYDLYSWGRGFEGQLGIGKDTASFPTYVNFFYQKYDYENKRDKKKIVKYIACGAHHSLAITDDGQLYSWGEARLGQTGTGKCKSERFPKLVNFQNNLIQDENNEKALLRINPVVNNLNNQQNNDFVKVICVSGGYGHSAAVLENGELYTWGLNIKGQLGHEGIKSSYFPQKVVKDILGNTIPLFKTVQCGYNNTFAIDINGQLWSWGGGNLGHKNDHFSDLPRKINENTQNRKFSEIHATSNSAVFFAPMRIMSVRPNYGPSCGGTLISLLGTGFAETGSQSLRFSFKQYKIETKLNYDSQTESFYCQTPKFDDASEELIQWPLICKLEVTLDGKIYTECEESYLIYSSKIQMTSIEPKCASVEGGTQLTLNINIDDLTATYLKHLTVGFQQRQKKENMNTLNASMQRKGDKKNEQNDSQQNVRLNSGNPQNNPNQKMINPLDLDISDPELEKENWICVEGFYDKGKITCAVPKLTEYNTELLNYNVDVSLNGQQFTGQPSSFRFYDIQINKLEPNNDALSGGATCKLMGEGFFDTLTKKIMFKSIFGERLIDINWDKKERSFSFIVPPITWLLGGQDPTPELIKQVQQGTVQVALTLNSVQWIKVSSFQYAEAQISRIGPVPEWEKGLNEEGIKAKWNSQEEIIDPLKGLNEAEAKKKSEELRKAYENEVYEMQYFYKKSGQYLYIHGEDFINSPDMLIQFVYNNQATVIKGVFKNSQKIGVIIPELNQVPQGIFDVGIEISYNGQCFSSSGKAFRYMSYGSMPVDQRAKWEDGELKNLKKSAPKPPK